MIKKFCIGIVMVAVSASFVTARAAVPILFTSEGVQSTGSSADPLLLPSAIKKTIIAGLRDAGLPAQEDVTPTDKSVNFTFNQLFVSDLENMRVVTGNLEVRVPKNNRGDYRESFVTCSLFISSWQVGTNGAVGAQELKKRLFQGAKNFVQKCSKDLDNWAS